MARIDSELRLRLRFAIVIVIVIVVKWPDSAVWLSVDRWSSVLTREVASDDDDDDDDGDGNVDGVGVVTQLP